MPKTRIRNGIQAAIAIVLVAAFIFVIGYHCPFRAVLHIPCPGCGMTRALVSLLSGNLQASLVWHPMLIPTIILGIGMLVSYRKSPKVFKILAWIWIVLMIVCWLWRLIFVFPIQPLYAVSV